MKYKDVNDFEVLYLVEENQSEYKNVIFEKYKPILKKIAYFYYLKLKNYGFDYDDCFQEALIGLNHAIDSFDFNKDALFYTFALVCIRSRLNSFVSKSLGNKNKILNESMFFNKDDLYEIENIVPVYFDDLHLSFYEKVLKFKNSLNDTQSQIFELKYNGFTNKEIGELLEINPRIVYNNVCYIRDRMLMSNFKLS
ncbi:MAG: sigma-70 family RNA polymerase sigma factor [Bacilli bacterium]|nr:sigma-70 family RNA polymerase sigma factor [Bacilli bacterium]